MKRIFDVLLGISLTVFLFGTILTQSAFALTLDEAKAQGFLGETTTGYIGAVKTSGEAQQLLQSVNSERRKLYAEIAARNGTAVSAVEALAGQKAIERTPAGQFVQNSKGNWVRK